MQPQNDIMRPVRPAFTLIELLVVIAILAILVALLLPAVQQVREAARKAQCQDHLHNLGVALHDYESSHRRFPPFLINRSGNPSRIGDVDKGANWMVSILPFVEQKPLYDQWDMNIPANQNPGRSTEIDVYKCPSDPNSENNLCNYAGGGWARGNYGMNVSPCRHGVGGAGTPLGGIGGANQAIRMAGVTDGTSNTVAIDEIRAGVNPEDLRGSWAMPGLSAGTAAMFNDASAPNSREPFSDDMENCAVSGQLGNATSGMGCFDNTSTGQMTARSMHPAGLQVLMVDGVVKFVTENIDFHRNNMGCGPIPRGVWQSIHTRDGGEPSSKF